MRARGGRTTFVVALSLVILVGFGLWRPDGAFGGGVGGGETTPTTSAPVTTVAPTRPPVTTVPRTVPTLPPRPTTPAATVPPEQTTTTDPTPDEKNTSATTIALIVGTILALLLILLVVVLIKHRRTRDQWADEARLALSEAQRLMSSVGHGLSTLSQPAAAAHTWSDVDAEGAQLHRRLQALTRTPPDDRAGAVASRSDQALQSLRSAIDSDRALRLGPPPPTQEQLGYSEAVVRQRATDFEQAIEDLDLLLREDR